MKQKVLANKAKTFCLNGEVAKVVEALSKNNIQCGKCSILSIISCIFNKIRCNILGIRVLSNNLGFCNHG